MSTKHLGKPMTNPFRDQEKFMRACDQSVDGSNQDQFKMYLKLIKEEFDELRVAQGIDLETGEQVRPADPVETLDALLDIIVVTIGAIHSAGMNGEGGWKEVMSTNFAKVDKETGKVRKREDGKVLKPIGWTPPDLKPFVK
jgi:predicted HAD superfamily Cof-like phosphohydrolase